MRYTLVVSVAAVVATCPAAAQTISGHLIDATTRQPIATGTLALLAGDSTLISVVTDSTGRFVLHAPQAGSYRLRGERIGYRAAVTPPLDLAANDTLRVEFRLAVAAVPLNPITILGYSRRPAGDLGGFYERMRRAMGGIFITRQDIENRPTIYTTDLLRTIPGAHLTRSRVGFGFDVLLRGDCKPRVFLDGVPIQLGTMTIDDLISPLDLEGIEVYRGIAEIPANFTGLGACGAIVLWTRFGR
jgi:hypothetical protein